MEGNVQQLVCIDTGEACVNRVLRELHGKVTSAVCAEVQTELHARTSKWGNGPDNLQDTCFVRHIMQCCSKLGRR